MVRPKYSFMLAHIYLNTDSRLSVNGELGREGKSRHITENKACNIT